VQHAHPEPLAVEDAAQQRRAAKRFVPALAGGNSQLQVEEQQAIGDVHGKGHVAEQAKQLVACLGRGLLGGLFHPLSHGIGGAHLGQRPVQGGVFRAAVHPCCQHRSLFVEGGQPGIGTHQPAQPRHLTGGLKSPGFGG
jgi:hypothetical protein